MSVKPLLPDDLWAKTPPEVQAAILDLVQVSRLNQNSWNSSKPPSTEPLHVKRQPPRPTSKKPRGGQAGHERPARELVPADPLTGVVEVKPPTCTGCGHALDGLDPEPFRHQVAELPEIRPEVIEYRLHRLTCPGCGAAHRAKLPGGCRENRAEVERPGDRLVTEPVGPGHAIQPGRLTDRGDEAQAVLPWIQSK